MRQVAAIEGTEYWPLGKVKRLFHVCDHWMLKMVGARLLRVLVRQGYTHRYSVADVERLVKEYPPYAGTTKRWRPPGEGMPAVGKAK
jgi:hypothetical protein